MAPQQDVRDDYRENVATNLLRIRQEQGLSREQLAQRAQLSFYTVRSIERRQRSAIGDTLRRLATALGCSLYELVSVPNERGGQRNSSLGTAAGAPARVAAGPEAENPLAAAELANAQGHWREAEAYALAARARHPIGSQQWALITLTLCSQMCQQAGDIEGALHHIADVEAQCRDPEQGCIPDPLIRSWTCNQRGWIIDEQFGELTRARGLFEQAAKALPTDLISEDPLGQRIAATTHHFILRTLSEEAMTQAGAWLPAHGRHLSPSLRQALERSLGQDWSHEDPSNPHAYHRRFIVDALLEDRYCLTTLLKHEGLFRQLDCLHLLDISRARLEVSNGEWDLAIDSARAAAQGYALRSHFPQGVALAAALEAYALQQRGLTRPQDWHNCLDCWMLTVLLHPYETHPLWRVAATNLYRLYSQEHKAHWMQTYISDLPGRVESRDGAFGILQNLDLIYAGNPSSEFRLAVARVFAAQANLFASVSD